MTDDAKRRLRSKVDRLTGPETEVVERVVDMVLTPIDQLKPSGTWLNFDEWMKAFLAQIKAHHSISNEPLSRTDFEAAFNNACAAVGWLVHPSTSATNRFYDTVIEVPGRGRLSLLLKASSAKGMSTTNAHISKLTEAAWVQDARTQAARRDRLVDLFREYRTTGSTPEHRRSPLRTDRDTHFTVRVSGPAHRGASPARNDPTPSRHLCQGCGPAHQSRPQRREDHHCRHQTERHRGPRALAGATIVE